MPDRLPFIRYAALLRSALYFSFHMYILKVQLNKVLIVLFLILEIVLTIIRAEDQPQSAPGQNPAKTSWLVGKNHMRSGNCK